MAKRMNPSQLIEHYRNLLFEARERIGVVTGNNHSQVPMLRAMQCIEESCNHCYHGKDAHAGDKCVFGPTAYQPLDKKRASVLLTLFIANRTP